MTADSLVSGSAADAWQPFPEVAGTTAVTLDAARGSVEATREGEAPSFLYVDCGVWSGDGRAEPMSRCFAIKCGGTVALCEFRGRRATPLLQVGPPEEIEPINKLIRALAGPQRMDVTILEVARCEQLPGAAISGKPTTYVFLPDVHLPLVTEMPELDPNLVPDPKRATCPCHGPVIARILSGNTEAAPAQYRAVAALLSRNPNDWFYMMAESHRSSAVDLMKFLERLGRFGTTNPIHLVQLGGLYDIYIGFRCAFMSNGAAAMIMPAMIGNNGESEFVNVWREQAVNTKNREALTKLFQLPAAKRTVLAADYAHGPPDPALDNDYTGAARRRSLEVAGDFLAENRPEPIDICDDDAPCAMLILRAQQAKFQPWLRNLRLGWRAILVREAARRWVGSPFGAYFMAHTHSPCLLRVRVTGTG